jgi:hypothetical protein
MSVCGCRVILAVDVVTIVIKLFVSLRSTCANMFASKWTKSNHTRFVLSLLSLVLSQWTSLVSLLLHEYPLLKLSLSDCVHMRQELEL